MRLGGMSLRLQGPPYVPLRTFRDEDLHELRLMALLHDLVRKYQRKGAMAAQ